MNGLRLKTDHLFHTLGSTSCGGCKEDFFSHGQEKFDQGLCSGGLAAAWASGEDSAAVSSYPLYSLFLFRTEGDLLFLAVVLYPFTDSFTVYTHRPAQGMNGFCSLFFIKIEGFCIIAGNLALVFLDKETSLEELLLFHELEIGFDETG